MSELDAIRERDARYWAEGYDPKLHDGRGRAALDRHAVLAEVDRLLDAREAIKMNLGIYEELVAGLRASQDPGVRREREGAIASLGETLAARIRAALARLDGAS